MVVPFWGLYLTLMLCYVYIVICVYIIRSTPLFCMHVCMDRRHVSAGSQVHRRTRRLVATKSFLGTSCFVYQASALSFVSRNGMPRSRMGVRGVTSPFEWYQSKVSSIRDRSRFWSDKADDFR